MAALNLIETDIDIWRRLQDNAAYMAQSLRTLGIEATDTTPIFPIIIGSNEDALAVSHSLWDSGIIGTAIRPPTVPVGESRIRLTVTAAHTKEQIDYVCSALQQAMRNIELIKIDSAYK